MSDQESQAVRLPTTMLGTSYPTGYVTAMFPDEAQAHAAVGALKALDFTTDDMVVRSGQQLLENQRRIREQRGVVDRIMSLFPAEEHQILADYKALAEQGWAVVAVHVPESDTNLRDQVATTLADRGGTRRHYFGKNVIVDL